MKENTTNYPHYYVSSEEEVLLLKKHKAESDPTKALYVIFDYGDAYHLLDTKTGATFCAIPKGWMPHQTDYVSAPIHKPLCGSCRASAKSEYDEEDMRDE